MKKTLLAALIAGSQLLLIKPATAITFNFSWTSEAEGLSIVGGSSVIHRATGTIDIDVMRGQDFTASDVTSLDITVTDGTNSSRYRKGNNINHVLEFFDTYSNGGDN